MVISFRGRSRKEGREEREGEKEKGRQWRGEEERREMEEKEERRKEGARPLRATLEFPSWVLPTPTPLKIT